MAVIVLILAITWIAVLWFIGGREPVYAIARNKPTWFVAIRGGDEALKLSPDVNIAWSSRADFAFIGAEAYWSRFYILHGGDSANSPADLNAAEDAFIARVKLGAPPRLFLGGLRLLVWAGVLTQPRGDVGSDVQAKGYRAELMPDHAAVERLLAQPASYAPCMVNFLAYYPGARYSDGRASSGRAAYARYGIVALRTVYRTGGRLLFYGRITEGLRAANAGPTQGAWSDVAAMRYPNPPAILSMEHVSEYRTALHHRDAGLERTIVIASTEQPLTS